MIIENDLLKDFNIFIKKKSIFGSLLNVLPDTPQSFSKFPTIVMKEQNNIDNNIIKSLNLIEYGDNLVYQIDIYTKDIVINSKKYASREVINELRLLIHEFFRNCGFQRTDDSNSEYIDISVKRRTLIFTGTIKNWNKSIM